MVDIILMVKNVYCCVAKAKILRHPEYIILFRINRLESLFGILRTMIGNDANLDVLQLALRVTNTTKVATLLATYPE
ncbi:hypothetical protein PENSPDRAFT_595118 [Peniophora sp. CONT]|nr:hypothetical protein PENSPDRAFT_595118 [Peniophora sp. CONT]